MSSNNPAGRLIALLDRGYDIVNPQNVPIKEAWRELLCEGVDDACLMRRLGFVYSLPDEITDLVRSMPGENSELLLREIPKIRAALDRPLTEAWQNFLQTVDATARYSLEVISDRLDGYVNEPKATPDQLAELLLAVQGLLQEALAAVDLPLALRQLLVRHLQAMARAIEEVRLRGMEAVREAVEGTVGGAVIYMQTQGVPATSEEKSFLRRLVQIATAALLMLQLGTGTLELGQQIYEALPIGQTEHETGTRRDGAGDPAAGP